MSAIGDYARPSRAQICPRFVTCSLDGIQRTLDWMVPSSPDKTQSVSEKSFLGSTGDPPVPSGDSPDEMRETL